MGYTVTSLDADARNACYSYGLTPGTSMYDRCVGREIDARRYRDQAYGTPVPVPAPGYSTTTYYTTAPAAPTYYGPATTVSTTTYSTPPVAPPSPLRRPVSRPSATSMVSAMMVRETGSTATATLSARSRPHDEGA